MKIIWFFVVLAGLLFSSLVGKVELSLTALLDSSSPEYQIFTQVRLPRTILAFLSGGILALSGLLFQTLFRNPLTTPFTLGISSGATLGAASAIIFGFTGSVLGFSFVTLFGFLGALSTVMMIYFFSKKLPTFSDHRLILVGIALSFLYSSLLLILYYMSDFQESYLILRFTMGTLLTVGYSDIVPIVISSGVILLMVLRYQKDLKLLSISSEFAYLRGVNVDRVLITLFVVISLSVGILVSLVGPISFIGLIIPHIVRTVMKQSIEKVIVPTFLTGGLFLLLCDTIARILPTISEIPVGIITSFIGGMVFVYILLSRREGR
ncbi:MAG: iron ABC transporter permease [Epsilonproteobacteria bacterium]|nr:iron ABC transporter permease [Campylobacterota bacterium]